MNLIKKYFSTICFKMTYVFIQLQYETKLSVKLTLWKSLLWKLLFETNKEVCGSTPISFLLKWK